MSHLNRFVGIGNVGQDPTLRTSSSGVAVCNFNIAIDGRPSPSGEKRTDWIPITVWGPLAEACGKYLQKGSQVCVDGQLRQRPYKDSEGKAHNSFEIRADNVYFLKSIRGNTDTDTVPTVQSA